MSESQISKRDTWIKQALGVDIVARRQQISEQVQSGGRARSNSFTLGERRQELSQEETAYLKRLGEVTKHVKAAQEEGVKLPDDLAAKLKQADQLARQRNYKQAMVALDEADALVTQAESTDRHEKLRKDLSTRLFTTNTAIASRSNAPPWFDGAVAPLRRVLDPIQKTFDENPGMSVEDITQSLQDIRDLQPQIQAVSGGIRFYAHYVANVRPKVQPCLAIKPGGSKELAEAQAALRKTDAALTANQVDGRSATDWNQLVNEAETGIKEVQRLSTQHISDLTKAKGAKKSDIRAKVVEFGALDPDILKRLAETPEGRAVLDDLMNDIGKTAKGKTDNKFVQTALEARFGAKFTGDLDNSAGPRLYSVFKMVPDEHTHGNPKIAEVKRNKNYKPVSWYNTSSDEDEGVGEHHIVINAVRTGGIKGWIVDTVAGGSNPLTHGAQKYRNVKGSKKLDAFNHVTLHEIGHGVDEKEGFMSSHGSTTAYGGWLEHSIEEVADVIGAETGFYNEFKAQPRALLRTYLTCALSKGFSASKMKERGQAAENVTRQDLLGDPGVQAADAGRKDMDDKGWKKETIKQHKQAALKAIALKGDGKKLAETAVEEILGGRTAEQVVGELLSLKPAPKMDWNALAKHEAIKICEAIKLSGSDKGLWIQGANAAKYAVGGRVYQEAYGGDWNSYNPSALSQRVTNYQFRAPGEWFADAYATYFLGKLPDGHPLSGWLDSQVAPQK